MLIYLSALSAIFDWFLHTCRQKFMVNRRVIKDTCPSGIKKYILVLFCAKEGEIVMSFLVLFGSDRPLNSFSYINSLEQKIHNNMVTNFNQ